ncbi:hypothetical protein ACFP9V_11585 [Deinococcus radiopugnans]|uniref:Rad50/SbcC-type AAA domain-containing protein n=1 Tax=Deinococcus radiopugnans ATCC 19172 TaxID=585398 RepID=A0A5C4Y987_9DEIO|nr:hypothetical protein [Deinococcus radiopugnans]MBB6015960.1 hypothetical protein [Deinococcus radiopugnans ATCC 19172]TNM72350.1 hypothetical protein FHR04_03370 [Deinococcus radiopugnans ATCC 19172]
MINITAKHDGQIKIIQKIPGLSLAKLEGRNGIGKSLAVKILQLATGDNPYETDLSSWGTLKHHMSEVKVEFTELRGGHSITWTTNTRDWPAKPDQLDRSSWIGSYEINSAPATLDDVRKIVGIRRQAGDQTLSEIISTLINEDSEKISLLEKKIDERVSNLSKKFDALISSLLKMSFTPLETSRDLIRNSEKVKKDLEADLEKSVFKLGFLNTSINNLILLNNIDKELPHLLLEISDNDKKLIDLRSAITSNQQTMRDLQSKVTEEKRLLNDLARLRKKLDERMDSETETNARIEQLLTTMGLSGANKSRLEHIIIQTREKIAGLQTRLSALDLTPQVILLINRVIEPMKSPQFRGVLSEIAMSVNNESLNFLEIRTQLSDRRDFLLEQPERDDVSSINGEIDIQNKVLKNLTIIKGLFAELSGIKTQILKESTRSQNIINKLTPNTVEKYQLLESQMAILSTQRDAALAARTKAQVQIDQLKGFGDRDDLIKAVEDAEEVLGDRNTWLSQQHTLQIAVESLNDTKEQLESKLSTLKLDEQKYHELLKNEFTSLSSNFPWILPILDLNTSDTIDSLDQKRFQRTCTNIITRLQKSNDSIEDMRRSTRNINGILNTIAAHVQQQRGGFADVQSGERTGAFDYFVKYYETEFSKNFENQSIRKALFDNGTFKRLDLENLTIIYDDVNKARFAKPLAAFSSGERAFAYTLSSLETLKFDNVENRIIVLDEFGAFIEYDRYQELAKFLQEKIVDKIATQVIIILPISENYHQQLTFADGDEKQRLTGIVKEIDVNGYFVRPLLKE